MEHLGFGRRTFSSARHASSSSSHKSMRQNLDRMESTVTAIPQALIEYMDYFNSFCLSGIKFASLLETMFQDTPVLLLALRFREACEQLNDKCNRSSMMLQGEVVPPITKKLAPSLSRLRNRVDGHAKALAKHESYFKQLENLSSSQNPNKQKLEQVEAKFKASATDFAKEDALLVEARNDVQKIRVEVMGSCFLSFLEAQSKLLTSASELIAPLGVYKEVGKGLSDSLSATVKEATVGWLAAAQVNQNLRTFGSLSRNDVQCMLYNHRDGLPTTISRGLNLKVDQLLKKYVMALKDTPNPHHKVTGGFHLNPKGIELALRDCCSELEAMGAGAPHAETKAEKEEQIIRDVPRVSYKIVGEEFGCAMGENVDVNIREKTQAIIKLVQSLPLCSVLEGEDQKVEEFASHILNETCTTVTNTAAKTAVQLVFGKANLVFVRPSPLPEDNHSVVVNARQVDSSVSIIVHSSWWLAEDYAAFSMLNRVADPTSNLGVVDVLYTLDLKLQNFIRNSSQSDLPFVSVTYRQTDRSDPVEEVAPSPQRDTGNALHTLNRTLKTFLSMKVRPHSPGNGGGGGHNRHGKGGGAHQEAEHGGKRNGTFQSYIKDEEEAAGGDVGNGETSSSGSSPLSHSPGGEEGRDRLMADDYSKELGREGDVEGEDEEEEDKEKSTSRHSYSSLRKGRGEGDGMGNSGGGGPSLSKGPNRSDSLGRGLKLYPIRRYPSNESMSSQSTLVAKQLGGEPDVSSITDILRTTAPGHGLTQSNIQDHIRKENSRHYSMHRRRHEQEEEEDEDEDEDYNRSMVSSRRRGHDVDGGGRRGDRRAVSGRRARREVKEIDEGPESLLDGVSQANERAEGTIASDSEVQSVIDFLSVNRYKPDYGGSNDPLDKEEQGNYLYSPLDYGGRHMGRYEGRGSGQDGHGEDWSMPPSDSQQDGRSIDVGGKYGSGGEEAGGKGEGREGDYVVMSRERSRGSKSASNSPRGEAEDAEEQVRGAEGRGSGRPGGEDQRYDGQNQRQKNRPRKKRWDVREQGDSSDRDQPEIFDVIRKGGLGQIIQSDPGNTAAGDMAGGMDLLRDSPGYHLSLSLYESIKDDSDSERSGRDSNPPVSSSSSEPQSPVLPRTRSTENIGGGSDRSSSRASSHSLPFSTSQNRDDDHFNHAPGARPSHSRGGGSSGGGPHFPKFEYDDHSQYGGGRGCSNSQDSNDPPWDLGMDPRNRAHYYHPYEYDNGGMMHNRGSYDSAITHSQERPSRPMPRMFGSRSLDDYSQPTGPPSFDRRGDNPMVLSGPMSTGGPPHGMRPGPPGQYGPPPPGPNSIPTSQGGPGPMQHMSMHHGPNGPMPPRGMPPPHFHGPPPGPCPHPHLNGGPLPPPGHGPHPPWYEYDGPRMRGPHPQGPHPPPQSGPPPHHSNSMHDNRFRPVPFGSGRSNTPSDAPSPASMHSMSPGPSPHPTPPPTPPPNMGGGPPMSHHPPMIPPGGLPHPPGPGMRIPPSGPPLRGPWEGPGPRDFRPPPPHNGLRGPPMGRGPLPKMHPPMPMYMGGEIRYPKPMPDWERNSWLH